MAYSLEGRSYLALYFNGVEYPFSEINSFERATVTEMKSYQLPMLNLVLIDGQKWLLKNGFLADNTQLRVVMGPGSPRQNLQRTMEFRIVHISDGILPSGSSRYVIDALLDAPRVLSSTMTDPIKGTSAQALSKIADYAGLKYEGVGTSDSQTWFPSNRRVGMFARFIAERGFSSENSCMMMTIDTNKRLVYRDVSSMEAPTGTFSLKDLTGINGIPVSSFMPNIRSGIVNQFMGLSSAVMEQVLGKETVNKLNKNIGLVVNDVGDLLMNAALKSSVGAGLLRYSPIDLGGNAHDNSERGRYQNQRGAAMFNSSLMVVAPFLTKVNILDTASVSTAVIESSDPSSVAYAGSYRVIMKTMHVEPGGYSEKFELIRRTLNVKLPESQAKASSTSASLPQIAKSVPVPAPIKSTANFLGFDTSKLEGMFDKVSSVLNEQNLQMAAVLTGAVSVAVNNMNSTPTVLPPLNGLLLIIQNHQAEGVAAILQQKAIAPAGDPENTIPPIVLEYKNRIQASITAALPELEQKASRTLAVAGATKVLTAGQDLISAAAPKFASSVGVVGAALSKMKAPPSFAASVTAASSSYNSSVNSTASTVATVSASATSQASSLETTATTYPQTIDAQKTTSYAALDAAALP